MLRLLAASCVLVCVSLFGCNRNEGTSDRLTVNRSHSATTTDSWNRFPPSEFLIAANLAELTPDQFALVCHKEVEALARLADSPWMKITADEAKAYAGRSFSGQGGELVLLRALALNEANGAFSVTWRSGEVRVHHGCLGNQPMPQTRRAIIARLPAQPTEVYVDCSMAE